MLLDVMNCHDILVHHTHLFLHDDKSTSLDIAVLSGGGFGNFVLMLEIVTRPQGLQTNLPPLSKPQLVNSMGPTGPTM